MSCGDVKYVPRKDKKLDLEHLKSCSQEELLEKIRSLHAHNVQLKNIISKNISMNNTISSSSNTNNKEFDLTNCWHCSCRVESVVGTKIPTKNVRCIAHKRARAIIITDREQVLCNATQKYWAASFHVYCWNDIPQANHIWDLQYCTNEYVYCSYTVQEDSSMTIEYHLINALLKCKLIKSRETSNYHRCGRTDKGVSAFSQVISITVRTTDDGRPLEYCKMLNRLLPDDIRVVAWQPVGEEVSARFNCASRTYKYFFPKANLNLEAMNEGAQFLIGTFDFRNLCKMDVGNGVTNFMRTISKAFISRLPENGFPGTDYEMCVLTLQSQAFIWHQVRCIVAILFLIGMELEKPTIMKELLDVQINPRKPQYPLASDIGLNLFETEFVYKQWIIDESEVRQIIQTLQKNWTIYAIKACQVKSCISELEKRTTEPVRKQACVLLRQDAKIYKPLLTRQLCSSLEEKIDHFLKRRRIQKEEKSQL